MIGHPVAPPGLPSLPGLAEHNKPTNAGPRYRKHFGNNQHESRAKARAAPMHPPPQADSKATSVYLPSWIPASVCFPCVHVRTTGAEAMVVMAPMLGITQRRL